MPQQIPTLYTIEETIKLLNVGRTSVYEEIRKGRLSAKKYGKRTLIKSQDIQAWIEQLPNFNSEVSI